MTHAGSIQPTTFLYREKNAVATITLNRPGTLNSLTFEVYAELRDTFEALQSRNGLRVVVITGQGRSFCSGGDVNSIIGELFNRNMREPELSSLSPVTYESLRRPLKLPFCS